MKKICFYLIFFLIIGWAMSSYGDANIKEPNVSGQFYTSNPQELSKQIDSFFAIAKNAPFEKEVGVVVVPHAGYVYSGAVAAYGFKAVSEKKVNTAVVIAASHYFPFNGISVWAKGGLKTPLGTVEVDEKFSEELIAKDEQFVFNKEVFDREHSLEVELPFLQKTFEGIRIVPIIIGQPDFPTLNKLAESLNSIVGERKDVLVVVSTDMSHFHNYETAKGKDAYAIEAVKAFDVEKIFREGAVRKMEFCGFMPLTAGMLYARARGFSNVDVLAYANSGDVTGDKNRVVGYTSIVFSKPQKKELKNDGGGVGPLSLDQKKRLIQIAKETIHTLMNEKKVFEVEEQDPRLQEEEGAFVTIHKHGRLRGCIGNILGKGPLFKTVRNMAVSAAVKDPRFPALTKEELKDIDIEISVLSKPWRITNVDEIQLGVHGVIVSGGMFNRGVYLPQVATETGWSKEQFLSSLCSQKAGLPADAWKDPKTVIEIFTASVFSEEDVE